MERRFHDARRRCCVLIDVIGIRYHWFPIGPEGRAVQEARLLELFKVSGAELFVLARYMQVFSPDACQQLRGRSMGPEGLTGIGHDIESVALNRAVRWHAEHRLFVHGNRTGVLR